MTYISNGREMDWSPDATVRTSLEPEFVRFAMRYPMGSKALGRAWRWQQEGAFKPWTDGMWVAPAVPHVPEIPDENIGELRT